MKNEDEIYRLKSIISCLVQDLDDLHGTCKKPEDCQVCLDVKSGKDACGYESEENECI